MTRLIDILAGKKGEPDPKDKPSGVKITFEPSAGMLETIEAFAKDHSCSLGEAAGALAALGSFSKQAVTGLMTSITETARKIETGEHEASYRVQELRLAEATGKKSGFEEAAKICLAVAKECETDGRSHSSIRSIMLEECAERIRSIKKAFIDETLKRLKVRPGFDGAPVVRPSPEELAQLFHETYETLAPSFGYETREASRKPWSDVPDKNKKLMIAVCEQILRSLP